MKPVLLVLVLLAVLPTFSQDSKAPDQRFIEVTGEGEVKFDPNIT